MSTSHTPYIPASVLLPETTAKAIILGFLLSAVLSAANAYMGLLLGMTVSASIPASVMSMAILRFFKRHNILENNIVQTAASSGESIAAGVIFTIPALVLMNYWDDFNYIETTLIAVCGGLLGVFFTIPLREALIVKENLAFPEGVATAEVLKAGSEKNEGITYLVRGSLAGGVIKFVVEGLRLWPTEFQWSTFIGGKGFFYVGTYLTPAVSAVGYIIGFHISLLVFLGGILAWYVGIPLYALFDQIPADINSKEYGLMIWKNQIRYLGVGAMIVGGIWSIIQIRSSLSSALRQGLSGMKSGTKKIADIARTDLDTPMSWILISIGVLIVPIAGLYIYSIGDIPVSLFMTLLMVMAGFLFSAVAGYMAGLVGSSNNPISGVTISTILSSALLLLLFMGNEGGEGAAASILIGAVVCCAAAIAGDNMQDLKSGHILGATPYKQQIGQIVGVVAGAVVLAPVLSLLHTAYGIGSDKLAAPQASLMKSIAEGVFGGSLPWNFILIGMAGGIVIILLDEYQKRRSSNFRLPLLAIAVGLYLPLYLDTAIFLGGLLSLLVERYFKKAGGVPFQSSHTGLLLASGVITGEAIIGIGMAIPIAASGNPDMFAIGSFAGAEWLGLTVLFSLLVIGYKQILKVSKA